MGPERKEHPHKVECEGHSTFTLQTSDDQLRNAKGESASNASWGARNGSEEDRDYLEGIIKAELIKPENHGKSFRS